MITQAIKHWLSNLFAWWPWKRTATVAYTPPSRNGAMGMPPEHAWQSELDDGSLPQAGARSVAVEQSNENATLEETLSLSPPSVEHVDIVPQSPTPRDVFSSPPLAQDEKTVDNVTPSETESTSETVPTSEQHMAFLQYLVSHGLINEGFEEGHVPEQYRPKPIP